MLIVSGARVILDSDQLEPQPATLEIQSGKITAIHKGKYLTSPPSQTSSKEPVEFIDAKQSIVMAGVVDAHVHINEPGRTDWEGFSTATCAAAAGGATTIVDMPLNAIPPTTTPENFREKLEAARNKCLVNVGFYGGVIPGNHTELKALVDMGVCGFKCFMIESGVDEFPMCTTADMKLALDVLSKTNSFLMFHAEVADCCGSNPTPVSTDPSAYKTFLESRPCSLENNAIDIVIDLCRQYKSRCHIVHLSSAEALPAIRKAKAEGLPLTVETCFHYLYFEAESIPAGATQYKCCPPIRDSKNRDLLWQAVLDGTIDYVVSDHSPCTANLKVLDIGDFMKAWGGIASVQFGLPALWSAGKSRGLQLAQIPKLLCENTAKQVGLGSRKGRLAVGYDADIVIWNPDESFNVQRTDLLFKNKLTPYEGKKLFGVVERTLLAGKTVYESSKGVYKEPTGELILLSSVI